MTWLATTFIYLLIGLVLVSLATHFYSFVSRKRIDPVEFILYVVLWFPSAVFFGLLGLYKGTAWFLRKIQGMPFWEQFEQTKGTPKLSHQTQLYIELAKQAERIVAKDKPAKTPKDKK